MTTKITDIAQLPAFYAANPAAIPLNNARDLSWTTHYIPDAGQGPGDSSKICNVTSDGKLLMARNSNGYYAVYEIATGRCLGAVPLSNYNGMPVGCNPRWDRIFGDPYRIVFTVGNLVRMQPWNRPDLAVVMATADAGLEFIDCGGDGDLPDDGRCYPVMLSTGYDQATGHWNDVRVGVCDLTNGKLSTLIPGKPDAIDISPDGKWLLWADGEQKADGVEPNIVYSIASLLSGGSIAFSVPSARGGEHNWKSCGHNGWARLLDGTCVWVFQDNRADQIRFWIPGTAANCFRICDTAPLGYLNLHFSRHAPKGYTIASAYGANVPGVPGQWPLAYSIFLIELATGKTTEICKTNTKTTNKENEAAASASWITGNYVFWNSNNNGASVIEGYGQQVLVPGAPTPTPPNVPCPTYSRSGHLYASIDGKEKEIAVK